MNELIVPFITMIIELAKDNSVRYQKHKKVVELQAQQLADEAEKRRGKIPNNCSINPDYSIVVPALQTCIPYLGNES